MRTFVEIVDRGSLTAAADALDRAPPTIVRSLAMLEKSVGARLLRRTTRRMTLTEEGRVYLERCRQILADVSEAEQALTTQRTQPAGTVRMTAPILFGQRVVLPALTAFALAHEKIQVEMVLLDRVVNLVEEGLDLGVRIGPLEDESMIAIPLGHMRRVTVASSKLLSVLGTPQHPKDLELADCVVFRGLTAGTTWSFSDKGQAITVKVRDRFVCNQALAAVDACAAGLGFGSFLHYQVEPLLDAGELVVLLEAFECPPLPVSLVYGETRLMSSRLRSLVDWLKPRLRDRLAVATS